MSIKSAFFGLVIVPCGLWTVFFGEVQTSCIWIDSTTGSMKSQRLILSVIPLPPAFHESELERWVIKHEGSHKPDWRFLSGTGYNAFGEVTVRACGLTPPIFSLHVGEINRLFVLASTDPEVAGFLHTMRNGTKAEKNAAVEAACDKAFRFWTTPA